MGPLAAGTIVAKSNLSLAMVLARSFHEHHPEIPFFVLLTDEPQGFFDPSSETFQLVKLNDLSIPELQRFRFQYPQQPLSYAATPYFLGHLLERGYSRVIFFKQESLVVGSHEPVFELLERNSIVLTPHLLEPLAGTDRAERELNILQSGVFNIGLLGIADTATSKSFLSWWQDRVFTHCRHAVSAGMHFEQRWIDLVPSYFDDAHILRDPGFNVAHWNLPERDVDIDGEVITVDGYPARLFRFSGFDPDNPGSVSRHSQRLTMSNVGSAAAVFARYAQMLDESGYQESKSWPYAYSAFDNGVPIPDIARQMFLDLDDEAARAFGDPFETAPARSFFRWLNQPVDNVRKRAAVTRLWRAVYQLRFDLQQAFPDILGADRVAFLNWTASSGLTDHGINETFLFHRSA